MDKNLKAMLKMSLNFIFLSNKKNRIDGKATNNFIKLQLEMNFYCAT